MALTGTALDDLVAEVDFTAQPAGTIQALAKKSLLAVASFAATGSPGIDIQRLGVLLPGSRTAE
jgi:hypothetical protein